MMNRKLKQALSDAFYAPPPARKAAFLKQHRRRELGRWELIALQVRYIRWWVWPLSLVLSSFILMTGTLSAESTPWYIAALTPFLALLVITENGRAQLYQMDELELACGELAGSDGFAYPEALYGVKIPASQEDQDMVRGYIKEHYSFTPSMVFVTKPFSFSQFLHWNILKGQIPIFMEKELDRIRRETEEKKQRMMDEF